MPFPIAPLKAFSESNMTATVNIWRSEPTQDPGGGWTEGTWEIVQTTKGRVGMNSGREAMIAGGLSDTSGAGQGTSVVGTASVPVGTDVRTSDRLEIDGEFFEVNAVLPKTIKASERVLVSRTGDPTS